MIPALLRAVALLTQVASFFVAAPFPGAETPLAVEPGAAAPGRSAPRAASESAAPVRAPTAWQADPGWTPAQRVAHATRARKPLLLDMFAAAGVAFPPHDLLFRLYKQERELEVWAGDGEGELRPIGTWGVCAASGELGPKRAEGDLQVPEGFYTFGYFHPASAYYLSALIDYPNASDRIRGGATPGGQIMMHGKCASIGCVAMTDERIEELYVMAWSAFRTHGRKTHVHMFPARDFDALLGDPAHAEHHAFWREIREGHDAFQQTRRLPSVTVARDGSYRFAAAP